MNIFDLILHDLILILFPVLFYFIYLFSNKNVNNNLKRLMFNFSMFSSIFLIIKFDNSKFSLITFFMISSIIIILFLKKEYVLFFIGLSLLYFFIGVRIINFLPFLFMFLIYLLFKNKKSFDNLFIDIFIILEFIIIFIYNFDINYIYLFVIFYLVIHIIHMLINKSEEIINYHMDYKKLQKDKQIRLSLFKITHEVKNPIAVCKCYLDMLDIKNKDQINKYIPIIKGEIERLLILLEDFLLVNTNNVNFDIMDINMLLEDVIDKMKPMLDGKNIQIKSNLIDDEIYINGDYRRLSQVFINLVKNSIEAIPEERKGLIKINDNIINNNLNIVIEDNGVGISNKIINKIKEPFYTTKLKGTGLGVSLSDEIIDAHKGKMDYYSKEGVSTKVVINLPLYDNV